MTRRGRLRLGCVLALLAAASGCSSGGLLPVAGGAKLGNVPLKAGSVALHPDAAASNTSHHIPAGLIRDGKYEVFTNGRKGAPPGHYRVTVVVDDFSTDNPPPKGATAVVPRSLIAVRYGHKDATPLKVEVVARPEAGAYDLTVTRD